MGRRAPRAPEVHAQVHVKVNGREPHSMAVNTHLSIPELRADVPCSAYLGGRAAFAAAAAAAAAAATAGEYPFKLALA